MLTPKQRRRLTHKVTILPEFLSDPSFCSLRMLTQDEPAILLGRLAMLALATLDQRRVVFLLREVDLLAAWTRSGPFGALLIRVGWGAAVGRLGIKLAMPEPLQMASTLSVTSLERYEREAQARTPEGNYAKRGGRKVGLPKRALDAVGDVVPVDEQTTTGTQDSKNRTPKPKLGTRSTTTVEKIARELDRLGAPNARGITRP